MAHPSALAVASVGDRKAATGHGEPPPSPSLRSFLVLAAGAAIATWLSLALTRSQDGVASMWITNGLIVAAWLLAPRAHWRALGIGALSAAALVHLALGDDGAMSVGLTAINGFEAWMIAFAIRRSVADIRDTSRLRTLSRVATTSTFLACMASATLATALFAYVADDDPWLVWWTWFTSHVLGMVTVATVTVTGLRLGRRVLGGAGRRLDFLACVGLLVLTIGVVLTQHMLPILFIAYLPLAFLTYRHGFAGVVAGTVVLAVVGGMAAGHGWGPFAMTAGQSVEARVLLLQMFVGAGCVLTYPMAVALADRRRLGQELAASKEELQAITDNVPVHIARLDAQERYTFANATLVRAIGLDRSQIIGRDIREIRAPDVYAQLAPYIHRALSGEPQSLEFHIQTSGRRIDYRSLFVPDVAADGTVCGFYSIAMDVSALKQAERELEALARTDALTGLANRRQLEEALAASVARAQRNGQALMMLVLDIDHFKDINDTHGHSVGDAVIREFAARLRECVYEVDLAARLGGDEFVVLIEYTPQAEVGEAVAQRIGECLRTPIAVGDASLVVSSSIGIGIHFPVRSGERLVELADEALYAAKAAGRATWRIRTG